jgi:hypothetical protein
MNVVALRKDEPDNFAALALQINAAYADAEAASATAVDRAIRCGELLLEAKRQLPHGEWLPWLARNCPKISERSAQRYMRLAEHADMVRDKSARMADLTLEAAGNLIPRKNGAERSPDGRPTTTKWPPPVGSKYVGPWPPKFRGASAPPGRVTDTRTNEEIAAAYAEAMYRQTRRRLGAR